MENDKNLKILINENSKEKIFPILRKIDYLWTKNPEKNLCDIIKDLNNGFFEYLEDVQLLEKLKNINFSEK